MLVSLRDINLQYGTFALLKDLNLVIDNNERIALIGRNGSGKSSLLKLINSLKHPDEGSIEYASGIKIGMLEQEFTDVNNASVFDIVASGLGRRGELFKLYNELSHQAAEGSEAALMQMQDVQHEIDLLNAWDCQSQIDTIITKLNLNADLEFNSLSGGLKRRVLLGKALVEHPDLLLLDEPTNHLDVESIIWLENLLNNWKTSVLIISHDRAFIRKTATRIIELDRGRLSDWPGTYEDFLRKKEEFLHNEQLENKRFDKKLANEEVWIRQGVKARRTRNEGRVRALKKMRDERAQRQSRQGTIKAEVQDLQKSGHQVIEALNISHAYSNEKTVIKNFSTMIMRGDKIAIIGPNGCGKTTLINILLGQITPNSGEIKHGTNLQIAYFDQLRAELDENLSVRDNVSGGSDTVNINGKNKHVIGYLQDFLFTPERANAPITALSGGERNRLLLAKLFTKPSNLLVLDEPTNDLDIEALELLEDLLVEYKGTLLLISHDREFINNVVTSTIVFEGNGVVNEYVGDYNDYIQQKPKSAPLTSSVKPKSTNTNNTTTAKVSAAPKALAKQLTYEEKKELNNLPKIIEKLEAEKSLVQEKTLAPGFYQQASAEKDKIIAQLKGIEHKLIQAYARWEELEQ